MSTVINVFSCSGEGGVVVATDGGYAPTCPADATGQWITVEVPDVGSASWLSMPVDGEEFLQLLGAVTMILVMGFLAGFLVRTMAGKR